jgi:hypothetical protein
MFLPASLRAPGAPSIPKEAGAVHDRVAGAQKVEYPRSHVAASFRQPHAGPGSGDLCLLPAPRGAAPGRICSHLCGAFPSYRSPWIAQSAGHRAGPYFRAVTPRGLLVAAPRATGKKVYSINPMAIARYRERYSPTRKKSDHADAQSPCLRGHLFMAAG